MNEKTNEHHSPSLEVGLPGSTAGCGDGSQCPTWSLEGLRRCKRTDTCLGPGLSLHLCFSSVDRDAVLLSLSLLLLKTRSSRKIISMLHTPKNYSLGKGTNFSQVLFPAWIENVEQGDCFHKENT